MTVKKFGVFADRKTPLPSDVSHSDFDEDGPDGVWPFRELVGSLL